MYSFANRKIVWQPTCLQLDTASKKEKESAPLSGIISFMGAILGTNRDLASSLLRKLVDLHVELAAMTGVLKASVISEKSTGRKLDWRETVAHHRAAINSSHPVGLYQDIENKLLASKLECPEALRLLIELAERPIES